MLLNLPGKSEKILENLHEVAFLVGGRGETACMTETRAGSGFFQDAFFVSYTYFPDFYKALLPLLNPSKIRRLSALFDKTCTSSESTYSL